MKLRDLAGVDSDSEVTGFAIDHRKVARGSIFGAFRGTVFNGEDFIGQAVERGAVAVVASPEAFVPDVPHLPAEEPRRLFADLAARYYGPYPETVVAVTSPLAYVRFHGRNASTWNKRGGSAAERFDYLYSPEELQEWAAGPLKELAAEAEQVFVMFNNNGRSAGDGERDWIAQAPENAYMLRDALRDEGVPVT